MSSNITAATAADDSAATAASPKKKSLHHVESDHIQTPSPLRTVLTDARWDLHKAQPLLCAALFHPLRDFLFDPLLAIACVLFPPLLSNSPKLERVIAHCLKVALFLPIRAVYCRRAPPEQDDSRSKSRAAILTRGVIKPPKFQPPSDARAAFLNAISFAVSAVGDIVGALTNPAKMKKWLEAIGQLKAYLDATGVGDELEESVLKPLLRGRLLDNLKILNDIQEQIDADRHIEAKLEGDAATNIETEVREGHRLMRFATAAYGVEMIKSAVDFEVDPERLRCHKEAIAIHTGLRPEDVRYMYTKDDGDRHLLHHFAAVDEKTKSIVLALRGTSSLSGATVDVQGMARNFCLGFAHHGMSEMAENVWEASGDVINQLFEEEELKDYGLIITGHSLGAGVACLLNIMCHVNNLVGERKVTCYGFAPPPTYFPCDPDATGDGVSDPPALVKRAIQNCTGYIHDNDAIPFLSIASIRRLAYLLDTVDNNTEHMWFYDRWRIYHEYKEIPEHIFDAVAEAARSENKGIAGAHIDACKADSVEGECTMIIPARTVVWMKQNVLGGDFEGYGCNPSLVAENTVFVSPDMISDHLAEMYEDALDALLEGYKKNDPS